MRLSRHILWMVCTVLFLLCTSTTSCIATTAPTTAGQLTTSTAKHPDQLLVALADGRLVALDEDTGKTLWTFETGGPLVSSANPPPPSAATADPFNLDIVDDDIPNNNNNSPLPDQPIPSIDTNIPQPYPPSQRDIIFPGTDGSLYIYRNTPPPQSKPTHDDDTNDTNTSSSNNNNNSLPAASIEKLPVSIRDLVTMSPAPTGDGSVVLGSQKTTVFLLDGTTGKILKKLADFDGDVDGLKVDQHSHDNNNDDDASISDRLTFVIGRKEYSVRSVHPVFGEQWNMTWSQLQRLSELEIFALPTGSSSSGNSNKRGGKNGHGHGKEEDGGGSNAFGLTIGAGFSLGRYDLDTGLERWQRAFGSPPIAAYTSIGNKIDLLGGSGQNSRRVPMNIHHHDGDHDSTKSDHGSGSVLKDMPSKRDDVVVVGVMKGGGLYAIPAPTGLFGPPGTCSSQARDAKQCDAPSATVLKQDDSLIGGKTKPGTKLIKSPDNGDNDKALIVGPGNHHDSGDSVDEICHQIGEEGEEEQQEEVCGVPLGLFPVSTKPWGSSLLLPPSETSSNSIVEAISHSGVMAFIAGKYDTDPVPVMITAVVVACGLVALVLFTYSAIQRKRRIFRFMNDSSGEGLMSTAAVQAGMSSASLRAARVVGQGGIIKVGRLQIGPGVLGYGSGGTIVFEGMLDGREVAVKRLLRQFYELAQKEIKALILSDEHPNIVRCFAMEEDHEFVYLALERCTCTLNDLLINPPASGLVTLLSVGSLKKSKGGTGQNQPPPHPKHRSMSLPEALKGGRSIFVNSDGTPTLLAIQIAEDVGKGLEALHTRGVVHRDLKPHNVLLTPSGRAKLSDMGLSRRLAPEASSFESIGSGGSSGWQAPEQLVSRTGGTARQTLAIDVFSFGLVVHFVLTGGKHPFGEGFDRDANIMSGKRRILPQLMSSCPEAIDLLGGMLAHKAEMRPSIKAVMSHPLWWGCQRKLSFLIAVSDRVEGEDRSADKKMYSTLESLALHAMGHRNEGSWSAAMDASLIQNLGKYRRYDTYSLRDLLRVIRNKHNHFREMPPDLQELMGPIPEGFLAYFASKYPGLLTACYYFALKWCIAEPAFKDFFPPGCERLLETNAPRAIQALATISNGGDNVALPPIIEAAEQQQQHEGGTPPQPLKRPGSAGSNGSRYIGDLPSPQQTNNNSPHYNGGINHSTNNLPSPSTTGTAHLVYPRKLGAPLCDFFIKTGHCSYGTACRFDHPPEYMVEYNEIGLPIRRNEPLCEYYYKNKQCKYGPACKFNHPPLTELFSGGGGGGGMGAGMGGEEEMGIARLLGGGGGGVAKRGPPPGF